MSWGRLVLELQTPPDGFQTVEQLETFAEGIVTALVVPMPGRVLHQFSPVGISLVRFGLGGRLATHTWPEQWRATLDLWAPISVLRERQPSVLGWVESHAVVLESVLDVLDDAGSEGAQG